MIPKTREAKSGEEGPEQGSIAELQLGIEAISSALREQWLWEENHLFLPWPAASRKVTAHANAASGFPQDIRRTQPPPPARAVAPPLVPRSGCPRPVQARVRCAVRAPSRRRPSGMSRMASNSHCPACACLEHYVKTMWRPIWSSRFHIPPPIDSGTSQSGRVRWK